jgi:hypothetical protein
MTIYRFLAKHLILFVSFVYIVSVIPLFAEGFLGGTLIETPTGYVPIEQLQINDRVICYDFNNNNFKEQPIIAIKKKKSKIFMQICIDGEYIAFEPHQKLYVLPQKKWVQGKYIIFNDLVLRQGTESGIISKISKIVQEVDVYTITVAELHNFCVSKLNIHAHNFIMIPAMTLAAEWSFGCTAVELVALSYSVAVAGVAIVYNAVKSNPSKNTIDLKVCGGPRGPGGDPCRYEDAPYHHQNSHGWKSASPKNGQAALDNLIQSRETLLIE